MIRFLFFLWLIACSFQGQAQFEPKIYTGAKPVYDKGFESNLYGGFEVGIEVFRFKFIAPEVGINYYSGQPNEFERLNFESSPPLATARYDGRFNSLNFSVAPKFIFGNEEAALVLLPEYNLGSIKASERFFRRNANQYDLTEEVSERTSHSFWTFSAGVEGDFFGLDRIKFSFLITYSTLDTKKAFEDLQFSETKYNYKEGSADGLGLTFRAYFDIFKN
ncbi:hypothetical protein ML462_12530 [Gramella lutea]|uniref:Outer membrane protein beta-barrel domain-containing protein n=1 Tax=Christiangramia lutea TaxID=1607951 RepID=A0A9X1V3X1_9FLAO|nr:hypothetical protein [Christiangramia lutea]MCH4823997.1 hypothetical protein [Christiangramia lutea]